MQTRGARWESEFMEPEGAWEFEDLESEWEANGESDLEADLEGAWESEDLEREWEAPEASWEFEDLEAESGADGESDPEGEAYYRDLRRVPPRRLRTIARRAAGAALRGLTRPSAFSYRPRITPPIRPYRPGAYAGFRPTRPGAVGFAWGYPAYPPRYAPYAWSTRWGYRWPYRRGYRWGYRPSYAYPQPYPFIAEPPVPAPEPMPGTPPVPPPEAAPEPVPVEGAPLQTGDEGAPGMPPAQEGEWAGEVEGGWSGETPMGAGPLPAGTMSAEALMEHLGHAAAETESDLEAEAFLGALVPLAASLAPSIINSVPQLAAGIGKIGRVLRRSRSARSLIRALPATLLQAASGLTEREARSGRPIRPEEAVRALARTADRVLGNPRASTEAYWRSRQLDGEYHEQIGSLDGR